MLSRDAAWVADADVRALPHVLHGLSKHRVVQQLKQVSLEISLCCSSSRIVVQDVWREPALLVVLKDPMHLNYFYSPALIV